MSDKKLALLHQLSQEAEPIGLPKLLEKLDSDCSERSVRRWLAEMVEEGLVEKTGEKRGSKYQVVQKQNRRDRALIGCFGLKSEKALKQVQKPLYERVPVTYSDDWFASYIPNHSYYIPLSLRQQLQRAGKRSKIEEPAGTYAHQIYNRILIDLSYNSSRLEGNTYSLLETQKLLLEGKKAEGKLDEEAIMILNHKESIRYLVNNAPKLEMTDATICTLHYLLSDGLLESCYSGKVRDHGVRIGGSTYIPFEDPGQLQSRLIRITEKAALIEDSFEQSLFLLVHVSYLQAFSDVNKRTARLSANIPLIKNNLVPLSFNDVDRDDYISCLIAIYELHDIHPLLDLYVFSYMRTCALYDSTIRSIGFDEIRVRYREQRRTVVRNVIENVIFG
ncbi:MAG: Fic family protein, partial [Chlamydiales bacterium]|nr:Fic family protein [Chlamydiales bacterium]